jgi:hypothetical protein
MYRLAQIYWSLTRTVVTSGWLLAVFLVASSAEAQVSFRVPPQCGSQQQFFASVRELQQGEAAQVTLTSVEIAERTPGAYELTLTGPDGSRVFTDADCHTLFRTAVVVAAAAARTLQPPVVDRAAPGGVDGATQADSTSASAEPATDAAPVSGFEVRAGGSPATPSVDPGAGSALTSTPPSAPKAAVGVPPPATLSPPASVSPPTTLPVAAAESAASSDRSMGRGTTTLEAFVAAGLGAAVGLSPDPTLAFELEGGLGSRGWGGVVSARYLAPSEATTEGDAGVRVESVGGRAAAYYRVVPRLRAAVGLSAYRMRARGVGIRHPSTDTVWLLAPELELALVLPLTQSFAAAFGLIGRAGLNTPSFQIQPETEVFELPRFGAMGLFRIEWARP